MTMLFSIMFAMKCLLLPPFMPVTYYNYSTCVMCPCVTANGEKFDPLLLTGAHHYLPFGTLVKVTYRGRSVVVRINDRIHPRFKNRLDITEGAAMVIRLKSRGKARCRVEVVK